MFLGWWINSHPFEEISLPNCFASGFLHKFFYAYYCWFYIIYNAYLLPGKHDWVTMWGVKHFFPEVWNCPSMDFCNIFLGLFSLKFVKTHKTKHYVMQPSTPSSRYFFPVVVVCKTESIPDNSSYYQVLREATYVQIWKPTASVDQPLVIGSRFQPVHQLMIHLTRFISFSITWIQPHSKFLAIRPSTIWIS